MMSPGDSPVIRLELRGMGVAISSALAQHAADIQRDVNALVEREVESFDFGVEVRNALRPALELAIRRAIEDYFSFGSGKDEIASIVRRLFSRASPE